MKDTKRYPRSYKTTESIYEKAMKRAAKEKTTLAQIIEQAVAAYADGQQSFYFTSNKQ